MYTIYFDSIQEGQWFKGLHPDLDNSKLSAFPSASVIQKHHPDLQKALSFDRPDIILCQDDSPILVVERTIEVPSGHNVGQRFARLVAAAKHRIPLVYFGPFKAYKHGGSTQGPRYMNLRLFYALEAMSELYRTPITTINWIVDKDCEIIRTPRKDARMIEYLDLFFDLYKSGSFENLRRNIISSQFEKEQHKEREFFIENDVKKPTQYDGPPDSVCILNKRELVKSYPALGEIILPAAESVVYKVGMKYVRSDPYTGTALLYTYLYCGGLENKKRNLILHFPHITLTQWRQAALNGSRKDVRLFKMVSDSIIFKDDVKSGDEL